jgi:hypothetical protein
LPVGHVGQAAQNIPKVGIGINPAASATFDDGCLGWACCLHSPQPQPVKALLEIRRVETDPHFVSYDRE